MGGLRKTFLGFGLAAAMTTVGFAQKKDANTPEKAPSKTEQAADTLAPKKSWPEDISGTWSAEVESAFNNQGSIMSGKSKMMLKIESKDSKVHADCIVEENYLVPSKRHTIMEGSYRDGKLYLDTKHLVLEDSKVPARSAYAVPFDIFIKGSVLQTDEDVAFEGVYYYKSTRAMANIYGNVQEVDGLQRTGLKPPMDHYKIVFHQITNPEKSLDQKPVTVYEDKKSVHFNSIIFKQGKNVFLSKDDQQEIERLGNYLQKECAECKVKLTGHTDNTGNAKLDQKLSEKRAEIVEDFLIEVMEISPRRIKTKGVGFEDPASGKNIRQANDTERERQQNRRVEIEIIQPK